MSEVAGPTMTKPAPRTPGGRPARAQLRPTWSVVLAAIALVAGVLFPFVDGSAGDLSLLTSACIQAIAALGVALLYGQLGLLSVAQGGLWGVGAYAAALVAEHFGLGFFASLPIAIVAGAVIGGATGLLSARLSSNYFLVATFLVGVGVMSLAYVWSDLTNGATGVTVTEVPSVPGLGAIDGGRAFYFVVLVALAVVGTCLVAVRRTRLGELMRSVRENEQLARSLGIRVLAVKVVGFVLAGAFAGLAGDLSAYYSRYVLSSQYDSTTAIQLILIVLLGGAEYAIGTVVGAVLVVFVLNQIDIAPNVSLMVQGVVFAAVILLLPNGIVDRRWAGRTIGRRAAGER